MNTMKTTMVSRRYQMVMLVGEGNVIIILHDEDGHKIFMTTMNVMAMKR